MSTVVGRMVTAWLIWDAVRFARRNHWAVAMSRKVERARRNGKAIPLPAYWAAYDGLVLQEKLRRKQAA